MAQRVPILRILGGLFFVLAGVAYYLGITIAFSAAVGFVVGGAAVILLAIIGHRASGADVAVFIIGLLVLGAFLTPGVASPGSTAGGRVTYTVPKSALSATKIDLLATTDVGSITVSYTDNAATGYQVNFTRSPFPFSIFSGVVPSASLKNETQAGAFVLNATARAYDISVAIGTGYSLNVSASTGTGSVELKTAAGQSLAAVSLQSGTGSVKANLTSSSAGAIRLETGTGSIELDSSSLAPNGPRVPITLQAGTGGVTLRVMLASGTAASIEATAGLGGVSHNLVGFSVSPQSTGSNLVATAGDPSVAATSFVIRLSTGTGSVTADAQVLG